jgi:hypothetical protein
VFYRGDAETAEGFIGSVFLCGVRVSAVILLEPEAESLGSMSFIREPTGGW